MSNSKRVTVYWTQQHQEALVNVAQAMKAAGIACERDGKLNVSQIVLYALKHLTQESKHRG